MNKYKNLIFAGTFDHLHIGHKKMLDKAFKIAEKVGIGITSDLMTKNKLLSLSIEKLEVRSKKLEECLRKKNYLNRAKIFVLHDIFGSSIQDNSFDSILVTKATRPNAVKVNKKRKAKGLGELKIITMPYVKDDGGNIISSERIRIGEIDREGYTYQISKYTNKQMLNDQSKKELLLPKNMRDELRRPLGRVIKGSENRLGQAAGKALHYINILKCPMVIAVGDIVTMSLLKIGFNPDVKIIDLRSRREEINDSNQNFLASELASRRPSRPFAPSSASESEVSLRRSLAQTSTRFENFDFHLTKNKASTINIAATERIKKSFNNFLKTQKKQLIVIKGEEDLLALPAILFAPLGSLVLYGQWNLGVVMVEVIEKKKKEIERILKKFS
ncbi:pantetheine-phosphate adenylyltransferase [Candidatus Roizmanbacteria bacterium]|nr:pantetheine-phosphate adenylyltransferase [Candidatus Roizmanbacteria bacterium]